MRGDVMRNEPNFIMEPRGTWAATLRHDGLHLSIILIIQIWLFSGLVDILLLSIGIPLIATSSLLYAALRRRRSTTPIQANCKKLYIHGDEISTSRINRIEQNKGIFLGNRIKIYIGKEVDETKTKQSDEFNVRAKTYPLYDYDSDQIQQFVEWIKQVLEDKPHVS